MKPICFLFLSVTRINPCLKKQRYQKKLQMTHSTAHQSHNISNIIKDQDKTCPQAVQAILNTIGAQVWNEAERLLVDLLQQVPKSSDLLEIAMFHDISKISNLKIFAFFTLSHKYFQCEFHQLIRKVTDLKTLL